MKNSVIDSLLKLKTYVEKEGYKGWDPYDGLNSKVFQVTPLKHWAFARLAWIQLFKRNPINLRKLFLVHKGHNPKGVALFLTGYCNLYKIAEHGDITFGTKEEILQKINYLAELLISLQSKGYSGACWGYNFDWQARGDLYFPAYTPTVVATGFSATALFHTYNITKNENWLNTALSSAEFVLKDLKRTHKQSGFLFSYAPLDGNNTVYNASLIGSKLLSYCYYYTKDEAYKNIARESVIACIDAQQKDGSWVYGERKTQAWIDSFHTGYNLEALVSYRELTGDQSYNFNIEKGFEFYVQNFFLEDGTPKYYHNKTYPIDIHCPAQFIVTLVCLNKMASYRLLSDKVLNWTIQNMQTKNGYFIYQKKKIFFSNVPYMRWSQAFMMYALSYYLLSVKTNS